MKHLRYLDQYIWKYKWKFLFGFLFVALSNVFNVIQPRLIREALDLVIQDIRFYNQISSIPASELFFQQTIKSLFIFGLLVVICALIMGVFMYFMRQTVIVMSRLVEYDLRKVIYDHYQKLDQAFYRRNKTGDLMARITEDVTKVRMYLGPAIMYAMNLTTLMILTISAMVSVNLKLTLYTLLPLPILSISIYFISNIIHRRSEAIQQQLSKLNSIAQEIYSGIRVVKSYVQERFLNQYFQEESEVYKEKSLKLVGINALFFPMITLLIGLSSVLTIFIGGKLVAEGIVTAGNIAEFVIYVNMLTWPATAIGWIASIVQQADASQKRINEFLSLRPAIVNAVEDPREFSGEIVFKEVTFVYPDTGIKALDKVSFRISPGEKIAIMGRTASGKSTIADLLMRFYDVSSGQILFDGVDIRDLDLQNLRERIGYVPQDVFLFSNTIAENVAFGQDEVDQERVEYFTKKSAVHKDIIGLPEQYNSMVGERGVTLSGGQKQRISMARALMGDPDIVLLDDSLSAVDTKTEKQITDFLNGELANKTSIIITHRISGHMTFDRILILEKGRIIESGTHETLLEKGGYYARILEQQRMDEEQINWL